MAGYIETPDQTEVCVEGEHTKIAGKVKSLEGEAYWRCEPVLCGLV